MPQPQPLVELCTQHDRIHVEVPQGTVAVSYATAIALSRPLKGNIYETH